MQESSALVATLKKVLRSKGITYLDVATHLDISEASVKRVFSEGSFTLERFEKICQLAEVSFAEIAELSRVDKGTGSHTYTLEQERFFAEHPRFLAFFDLLIRFGSLEKVRAFANLLARRTVLDNILQAVQYLLAFLVAEVLRAGRHSDDSKGRL